MDDSVYLTSALALYLFLVVVLGSVARRFDTRGRRHD